MLEKRVSGLRVFSWHPSRVRRDGSHAVDADGVTVERGEGFDVPLRW